MLNEQVIFKVADDQVSSRTEYRATVVQKRDGGLLDLLVDGTNHEGESPFRVTCVACHKDVYQQFASWRLPGEALFDKAAHERTQAEALKRAEQAKRFNAPRAVTL